MFNLSETEIFFRIDNESNRTDIVVASIPKDGEPHDVINSLSQNALVIPINYPGLPRNEIGWFDLQETAIVTLSQIIEKKILEAIKKLPIGASYSGYEIMFRDQLDKKFRIVDCAIRISAARSTSPFKALEDYIFSIFNEVLGIKNPDTTITEKDVEESFEKDEFLPVKFFGITPVIERNEYKEVLVLCKKENEDLYAVLYIEDETSLILQDVPDSLEIYKKLYAEAYYCSEREVMLMIDRQADFFDFDNDLFEQFKNKAIKYIYDQYEF